MMASSKAVLAFDVGSKRIGLATATVAARLPYPLITLKRDDNFFAMLDGLIKKENIGALIVGLPRGLDGQVTSQTDDTRLFADELKRRYKDLPFYFQDEAVTSRQAEAELEDRGKPYDKADIDALAATYILQDWLNENKEVSL